jgi:hypothetical protein
VSIRNVIDSLKSLQSSNQVGRIPGPGGGGFYKATNGRESSSRESAAERKDRLTSISAELELVVYAGTEILCLYLIPMATVVCLISEVETSESCKAHLGPESTLLDEERLAVVQKVNDCNSHNRARDSKPKIRAFGVQSSRNGPDYRIAELLPWSDRRKMLRILLFW